MNLAWEQFFNSRFRYRTPRVCHVPDHQKGTVAVIGSWKTNKAAWAQK